jgi:hypothetical protein
MEFHLVYQGELPAAGQGGGKTRTAEKHAIRKVFHKQLSSLWRIHPFLVDLKQHDPGGESAWRLADRYERCGYKFLPLVSSFFSIACSLDVLFLRRDGPGQLVKSGGDIDNRVKVLFDALRMPQTCDELCGETPGPDETPFFCLMEDDALISKVQIETNWLLTPLGIGEHIHDVHLIVRVKTIFAGSKKYETAFQ